MLGIDPGFRLTGYGIVDSNGQQSRWVASGVIDARRHEGTANRLKVIHAGVAQLIATHQPAEMAVERVFVAQERATVRLNWGRRALGRDLCVLRARGCGARIRAREVKQAIVGKRRSRQGTGGNTWCGCCWASTDGLAG